MQVEVLDTVDRDLSDPNVFADITTVPFLGYFVPAEGDAYLEFDGDLTAEEKKWVVFRATTTPNEETIYRNWTSAMGTLQTYIDLTNPTAAQTTAAVKFQARVLRSLLRWNLQDFTGTT